MGTLMQAGCDLLKNSYICIETNIYQEQDVERQEL